MKTKLSRWLTLLLVLMVAPFSAMAQTTDSPAATNAAGQSYVLDYFANTPLDVSQYQGKALFLNFFTSWCSYCMQEMPEVKQIFDTYDPQQVAVVLVHVWNGENADASATVVEKFGLQDMIMLEDEQQTLADTVSLTGFPTSVFIDQNGYLAGYESGALTFDSMSAYLDQMNVGKRADASATTASDATIAPTATPKAKPSSGNGASDATTGATSSGHGK
jgi:thiol-disulfide isomerase/thioredoxin